MIRRWLDFRGVILAAVLAVAAALPYVTTRVERRDCYFFDVTLTSDSAGTIQLFWDQANGFTEYDSSRQPIKIEPKPVGYRFMMPMGEFKALRLDPIDGAGVFTFRRIQIADRRGRIVKVFEPDEIVPASGIRQVWTERQVVHIATDPASSDPVIELRLTRPLTLSPEPIVIWEQGWPVALPVFALGLLLSVPAIARRLRDVARAVAARAQAHPAAALALTAALAVAVQCHPVLFFGRSFVSANNGSHMLYQDLPTLPGDTYTFSTNTGSSDTGALLFQHLYYPMVQRDALAAGELPLWNRYSLSGEPLLGQGQSMFGDPFNFLTIATDGAAWAWDVRFLLARWILAAALGGIVWRLTRHLGAALLTTVGAGFLGFFTYRLTHPSNFSVCYSPLILLAWTFLLTARTPRELLRALAGLVAANWLVFTSGTVKEAYMILLGLNFAGVLLLWLRPEAEGRRQTVLVATCVAGAGFVLLSAPGWASFLSAWSHSMTGYDTPLAHVLPWSHVIGFFDDIFYRQTQKEEAVLAPAINFLFLLGALWWFVQPRRWRAPGGAALVLAAIPPAALAFGIVPTAAIEKIPFVANIVHVGNTFSCILLVLVIVLAGLGFRDAWTRLGEPDARGVLACMAVVLGVLLGLYFATAADFPKSPFFAGYFPALLLGAIALALGARWTMRDASAPAALCVALGLGLPVLLWRHAQFVETRLDRYVFTPGPRSNFHATSPAIDLVSRHRGEPGRVAGFESILYPSYNTVLRWEGVYGVDAVRSRHYHDLADALGLGRVWNWDWPNREANAADLVKKYDAYNVTHWLATPREGPHEFPQLRTLGRADLDVYASPTAWPRAFFCDRLASYEGVTDLAKLLVNGDGRPFAASQRSDRVPGAAPAVDAARTIRPARDYLLRPNATTFTVDAPGAGVAVLLETYYLDDFEVTVNGRRADYFRVNHAFKGVAIPAAGTYEIRFRYWPKHFTGALWAGAVGAILLGFGAVWLWRRPLTPLA